MGIAFTTLRGGGGVQQSIGMVVLKAAAKPIIGEGSIETLSYPCNIGTFRESIFHCRDHYCKGTVLVFIHDAVPALKRYEKSL
jgi:hypothetical protein